MFVILQSQIGKALKKDKLSSWEVTDKNLDQLLASIPLVNQKGNRYGDIWGEPGGSPNEWKVVDREGIRQGALRYFFKAKPDPIGCCIGFLRAVLICTGLI